MTETTLGLLRHGQTDWNIDLRLQGVTDIPLNATGLSQADAAGRKLNRADWDFVCSSPLSRARVTAEIVAGHIGIPEIAIEDLLLERSFGEAEGLTYPEWKAAHPTGVPPQGETLDALRDRAHLMLDRMLAQYRGTRVLAVSHGAMIRKLLRIASNGQLPGEGERIGNTSLNILKHDGTTWMIASYRPESLG
ncbi:MAG: histidine phosphatase family protein [Micrococcales bacterium]